MSRINRLKTASMESGPSVALAARKSRKWSIFLTKTVVIVLESGVYDRPAQLDLKVQGWLAELNLWNGSNLYPACLLLIYLYNVNIIK